MARLDWEKTRDRDLRREAQTRSPTPADARRRSKRQAALAAFVEEHGLACFKCGAVKAEWAKTGISKRGPWAICVDCVAGRDVSAAASPPRGEAASAAAEHKPLVVPLPAQAATLSCAKVEWPVIYTDGACVGNGRKNPRGGYAAIVLRPDADEPLVVSGHERPTTNNRMEMRAVIEGLNALERSTAVEVVTDSNYVMKGFTVWLPGWIRHDWRTSSKQPVKNAELWVELTTAVERHGRVQWRWTRGHSGDRYNEMADEIAQALAAGG